MNYEKRKEARIQREKMKMIMSVPIDPNTCRYLGLARDRMNNAKKVLRGEMR